MHLTYFLNPCPLIMLLCFANNIPTDNPLSGFWNFLFQLVHYEILAPSRLYFGVITTHINFVCFTICNFDLFLCPGNIKFFSNSRKLKDWKLMKFHFDTVQNRGLEKCMKQNLNKTTFTLFTIKTNDIHFVCKLYCIHIALYHCVKDISSL
jgi:hypothetical protein